MAINETVRDIENNPNKSKTVTLDLQKVVPIDNDGDEVYVVTSSSTATKIGGSTANPIFVREFKAGFCKSSGFKNPPFNISSSNLNLKISIDGSAFRAIALAIGNGLTGEDVAKDLESKINALAGTGQVEAANLAFLNATVEFKNNRFNIVSGSISNTYTGVGKSSVDVDAGDSNSAHITLGFDKKITSEALASKKATEASVASTYTAGELSITVNGTDDLSAGYAFSIYDGTNREYFVASGISVGEIGISGTTGLSHSYAVGSVVQRIFERDPMSDLASPYEDLDAIVRFSLRSIANQLDFSV
jgi:hypothetical protein